MVSPTWGWQSRGRILFSNGSVLQHRLGEIDRRLETYVVGLQ